jgi:hypothetical protein
MPSIIRLVRIVVPSVELHPATGTRRGPILLVASPNDTPCVRPAW